MCATALSQRHVSHSRIACRSQKPECWLVWWIVCEECGGSECEGRREMEELDLRDNFEGSARRAARRAMVDISTPFFDEMVDP